MNDVREQLARLARDLALTPHGWEQDWGMELSDGSRLGDFLRYYAEQETDGWLPVAREEYADLVFQSARRPSLHGVRAS